MVLPHVVAHTYRPSTQEAETGGTDQGSNQLLEELQANVAYSKTPSQNKDIQQDNGL